MFIKEALAGIIFQFGLAVAAISVLFFTIVKDVEGKIVLHEVESIVKDINDDIRLVDLDNKLRKRFLERFDKSDSVDTSNDSMIVDQNSAVQSQAIQLNLFIVAVCVIVSGLIKWRYNIPIRSILVPSILGVVVIVAIELFFLFVFVSNYIVLDSNDVKQNLLNKLLEKYSTGTTIVPNPPFNIPG